MVSYRPEHRTLFSADAFGTFGTLDGGITDSQVRLDHYWDEMRRYYASCIVGKYGVSVQKALAKPRHTAHRDDLLDTRPRMAARNSARARHLRPPEPLRGRGGGVVLAYGSMYGNTEQLADEIARALAAQGVGPITVYNLSTADISHVLRDVFRYDTLIVGSPTYNGELFPEVEGLLQKLAARNIPQRNFACFGSYTWAGAAVKKLQAFAEQMKWNTPCSAVEMKQGLLPRRVRRKLPPPGRGGGRHAQITAPDEDHDRRHGVRGTGVGRLFCRNGRRCHLRGYQPGEDRDAPRRTHPDLRTRLEGARAPQRRRGRLHFATDLAECLDRSEAVFSAVGTPPGEETARDDPYARARRGPHVRTPHPQIHGPGHEEHRARRHGAPHKNADDPRGAARPRRGGGAVRWRPTPNS